MKDSGAQSILELRVLDKCQSQVMATVMYFDIFRYPLTLNEIFHLSGLTNLTEVQNTVASLIHIELLSTLNGKYFLFGKNEHVFIREDLNRRAAELYSAANRYTKLISKFPFVRAVLITGSLSKGCMEKDGDIDYLIITEPGRLWLCRALLTFYKKAVLFNSRKYFCVNYYLDSESLHIPDHNLFTATEIASAKPAYNLELCERFFISNNWTANFNRQPSQENFFTVHQNTKGSLKKFSERILNGAIGETADEWLMRLFVWRWKTKFKGQDKTRFEVNFRSRKNVSKHHPHGFQFKVLQTYEQNLKDFEQRFNVKLT